MPQLDGLRCFAALLVVAQHATHSVLAAVGRNGYGIYGVWLFFVLSGFLITGILLRARDAFGVVRPGGQTAQRRAPLGATVKAFYARRFLRIFPLYYAVVAVGALLDIGTFRSDLGWHLGLPQ